MHQAAIDTQIKGVVADQDDKQQKFSDVAHVVELAMVNYPNTLLFLESAKDSANDSPYRHPERVARLFEVLDELVAEWQKNKKLGRSWKAALKEKGFEYKEWISQTSRGKYGDDYTFVYDGNRRLFENHVTIGAKQANNCISVHWLRDEKRKIIVVGFVADMAPILRVELDRGPLNPGGNVSVDF